MTKDYGLTIVKDFPVKGVNFIDINGLLNNPVCFQAAVDKFCMLIAKELPADTLKKAAIITPQARGFLFGAPVAYKLGLPLVLVRKKGKIPNKPYVFHITNEYDDYDMEIDSDLLAKQSKKGKSIVLALHVTAVPALKGIRESTPALRRIPTKEII